MRGGKLDGLTLQKLQELIKEHKAMLELAKALDVSRQRLNQWMRKNGFSD